MLRATLPFQPLSRASRAAPLCAVNALSPVAAYASIVSTGVGTSKNAIKSPCTRFSGGARRARTTYQRLLNDTPRHHISTPGEQHRYRGSWASGTAGRAKPLTLEDRCRHLADAGTRYARREERVTMPSPLAHSVAQAVQRRRDVSPPGERGRSRNARSARHVPGLPEGVVSPSTRANVHCRRRRS